MKATKYNRNRVIRVGSAVVPGALFTLIIAALSLLTGPSASAHLGSPGSPADTATATNTPTATNVEPEVAILQYVVDAHADWTCGPIGGTAGHRTLNCYTGAGHTGSGSVDNYGDPAAAQANWQQRHDQAQAAYSTFYETSFNGNPGYHGEGDRPPYNFFTREDYYLGGMRVLGGIRVDDTSFHYAPDIATAIMNAASALGYLPPASTPTPTITSTSTLVPSSTFMPTSTTTTIASTTFIPVSTITPTSTSTPEPLSCTLTFSDVPPDHTFYGVIMCLACRGIVSGYSDGTFRPGNDITRGQIAKIVSGAANYSDDPGGQMFEDVPLSNTFYTWVNRLALHGVIGGYACGGAFEPCGSGSLPYFRPGSSTTRGQLAKIVSEAAGFTGITTGQTFQDVPPSHPFYIWIERLASQGIISGYPCSSPGETCVAPDNLPYFRPTSNVTRGQAVKIVAGGFALCTSPGRATFQNAILK